MAQHTWLLKSFWTIPHVSFYWSFNSHSFLNYLWSFKIIILVMKARRIVACDLLVIELKCKFLNHELMDFFGGHLSTILVTIKLWIHFCNSSKFYQMTLLYIEGTWYIWFMGFRAIFKGYFGFSNFFFQVDHENSSSLSKSLVVLKKKEAFPHWLSWSSSFEIVWQKESKH
jgi:hypothetical protein